MSKINFAVSFEYRNPLTREIRFLHSRFYENKPSYEDIESLKDELKNNEEFGVTNYFKKYNDKIYLKVIEGNDARKWFETLNKD
jgi:hypothetical protein